jgi:hypothetical protein
LFGLLFPLIEQPVSSPTLSFNAFLVPCVDRCAERAMSLEFKELYSLVVQTVLSSTTARRGCER